jgi:hypothetical protein
VRDQNAQPRHDEPNERAQSAASPVASGGQTDVGQLDQTLNAAQASVDTVKNQLFGNSAQIGGAITYLQSKIDFPASYSAKSSASATVPSAPVSLPGATQAATNVLSLIKG